MLEEARKELSEARERAQLSPAHTFSPLPNFFRRPAEMKAIESALQGDPAFTVLFGASSVGKVRTAFCADTKSVNVPPTDSLAETGAHQVKIFCPSL